MHRYSFNNSSVADSVGGESYSGKIAGNGRLIFARNQVYLDGNSFISLPSTLLGMHDSISVETWLSSSCNNNEYNSNK